MNLPPFQFLEAVNDHVHECHASILIYPQGLNISLRGIHSFHFDSITTDRVIVTAGRNSGFHSL